VNNTKLLIFSLHGATSPCGLGPLHYRGLTITHQAQNIQ